MIFTVFDIETTGFDKSRDEILEFGYIQVNEDLEIIRYGSLYFYKESFPLNAESEELHKLTREFLLPYRQDFGDNLIRLYTIFNNSLAIGKHSGQFDNEFVTRFMQKHAPELGIVSPSGGYDMEKFYTPIYRKFHRQKFNEFTRKLGTLEELMEVIGYTEDRVRSEFNELFELPAGRDNAHCALYDTFMTFLLLKDAVTNRGFKIINRGGKSSEEQFRESICRDIVEMHEDILSLPDLFGRTLRNLNLYNKLDLRTRVNIHGYTKFVDWCMADSFINKLREAKRVGLAVVWEQEEETLFIISELVYWMIENYLFTRDTAYLLLGSFIYRFYGMGLPSNITIEPKDDSVEAKVEALAKSLGYGKPITLEFAANDNSCITMLSNYMEFRKTCYGAEGSVSFESAADIELFKTNQLAFWRKAIPVSDYLLRDFVFHNINWTIGDAYGVSMLINQRGGLI